MTGSIIRSAMKAAKMLSFLGLGNHDGLGAGGESICLSTDKAGKAFGLTDSGKNTPMLFLFESVDSLLRSKFELFEKLGNLPFYTYLNIGFDSVNPTALTFIRKPF